MGGQLGYEGLWIDEDFIHGRSRAGPVCTTYQSPQLSYNEDFTIEEVEGNDDNVDSSHAFIDMHIYLVILVRPSIRDDDNMMEPKGGVFSRDQNMEFMEMAGKKMYSKDLPEPERREEDQDK